MSFHAKSAYVVEPADSFDEPLVLPRKRRPRLALAVGTVAPAPTGEPRAEGLDDNTLLTWPPPSRPPASPVLDCHGDDASDGVPRAIRDELPPCPGSFEDLRARRRGSA